MQPDAARFASFEVTGCTDEIWRSVGTVARWDICKTGGLRDSFGML